MPRNLFISIQENPEPTRRHTSRSARGNDPGGDYVQPDPDNPGGDYVQPDPDNPGVDYVQTDPDNPGVDYVQPDPDNPESPIHPYLVRTSYASAAPPFFGTSCCCSKCEDSEDDSTTAPARDYSGFVIVRLAADVRPLTFGSLHQLAKGIPLPGLQAALEVEMEPGEMPGEPDDVEEEQGSMVVASRGSSRRRRPRNWVGPWPPEETAAEEDEPERAYQDPPGVLRSAPLVDIPAFHADCDGHHELRKATLYAVDQLERQAHTTSLRPRHSLAAYWRVDLRPYPDRVQEVVDALNRLREVDVAYRELSASNPSTHPPLEEDQGYLVDAPVGIGARWAWQKLTKTQDRPKICDLEQGWILNHEAFGTDAPELLYGSNRAGDDPNALEAPDLGQHGTAVLGQLAASHGVTGAIRDADFRLASHYKGENVGDEDYPFPRTNGHVAAAIVNALVASRDNPKPLEPGDVLLLEVQRGRFPTEIDAADFDAIRLASALGIIVVEAAGNGNYDLDRVREPVDGRTFRRGDGNFVDSGAVFVGAALSELPHNRAPFSNFGSRVDCFAWGEGVTTTGYGDLMGDDVPVYYTNTFSGTSSAAPVIAGAAALVQSLHREQSKSSLRPRPMRSLLSNPATGVRQGPDVGGHIGIMPDLQRVVGTELLVVPQLYLRKRPGDEGEPAALDRSVSSSPDILVWSGNLPDADLQKSFGSGSPFAHDPTPGETLVPGKGREVHVRLCNRGGGAESGRVHVFAGPAATWVSPELWAPVGDITVSGVRQGDTLAVSGGLAWSSASGSAKSFSVSGWSPEKLHSLLAVLEPEEAKDRDKWLILPPGPPYFQWSSYRKFMRRRGVAWRNAHRVVVSGKEVVLACHVAGTPDRDRRFDFEVIQRLPKDAEVTLAMNEGLGAKLYQRQPLLMIEDQVKKKNPDVLPIILPRRRSTRFGRVSLPAHAFEPVWLQLQHDGALGWGHSLAVRQLWRGEEIGRITWHFARS